MVAKVARLVRGLSGWARVDTTRPRKMAGFAIVTRDPAQG